MEIQISGEISERILTTKGILVRWFIEFVIHVIYSLLNVGGAAAAAAGEGNVLY